MKYLLFGDIHGKPLDGIESIISLEDPDHLICTGDFDLTDTIHEMRSLEQMCTYLKKPMIVLPGNHEHAILNGYFIRSDATEHLEYSDEDLFNKVKEDQVAFHYIKNLFGRKVKNLTAANIFLDIMKYGGTYNTIVIHGALDGEDMECPDDVKDVWQSLYTESDHKLNFKKMKELGHTLMFRGHDHKPSYARMSKDDILFLESPAEGKYNLEKECLHTITPGAYCDGFYALIYSGEDISIVDYRKIE